LEFHAAVSQCIDRLTRTPCWRIVLLKDVSIKLIFPKVVWQHYICEVGKPVVLQINTVYYVQNIIYRNWPTSVETTAIENG